MATLRERYNELFQAHDPTFKIISKIDITADRDTNIAILMSLGYRKDALIDVVKNLENNFKDTYPTASEKLNSKNGGTKTNGFLNLFGRKTNLSTSPEIS